MTLGVERSFSDFRDAVATLPLSDSIDRDLLERDPFVLGQVGPLTVVYAPFDYVNVNARLALVGVTPGWTQMHASYVVARSGVEHGDSDEEILRRVKRDAAFSGSLRKNLVSMLDGIGVALALGLDSTAQLFDKEYASHLHSTSAVRYPVFNAGRNYSGSRPAIADAPLLAPYLDLLAAELQRVEAALVVPLGKAVEGALKWLAEDSTLALERCLFGFPHPSGAYAGRVGQYELNRDQLTSVVDDWFHPSPM